MLMIFDGPNGVGKTTLINNLKADGYKTLSSPNGTPLAKLLRPICRGVEPWSDVDPRIQFMLFSAARFDEYVRLVENEEDMVFADRWWTSTYVYQCMLQGLPVEFLRYTLHPNEKIGCVILLDAKNEILVDRVLSERKKNPDHGICSWTQEMDTVCKLADLYRYELKEYLDLQGIKNCTIDTSNLTEKEVFERALSLVELQTHNR